MSFIISFYYPPVPFVNIGDLTFSVNLYFNASPTAHNLSRSPSL